MTSNSPLKSEEGSEQSAATTEGTGQTLEEFSASIDRTLGEPSSLRTGDEDEAGKRESEPHFTLANSPTRPTDNDKN